MVVEQAIQGLPLLGFCCVLLPAFQFVLLWGSKWIKGIKNGKKRKRNYYTQNPTQRRSEDILHVIYSEKHYIFTFFVVSMFISISNLSQLIIVCFFYMKKKNTNKKLLAIVRFIKEKKTHFTIQIWINYDRTIAIHILRIVSKII